MVWRDIIVYTCGRRDIIVFTWGKRGIIVYTWGKRDIIVYTWGKDINVVIDICRSVISVIFGGCLFVGLHNLYVFMYLISAKEWNTNLIDSDLFDNPLRHQNKR